MTAAVWIAMERRDRRMKKRVVVNDLMQHG